MIVHAAPEAKMLKSILVGLEDSASTERATELALELAQAQGASCSVWRSSTSPTSRRGPPWASAAPPTSTIVTTVLMLDAHQRAREFERRFLERCKSSPVAVRVLEVIGRPAETILGELEHHDLVMLDGTPTFNSRPRRPTPERGT